MQFVKRVVWLCLSYVTLPIMIKSRITDLYNNLLFEAFIRRLHFCYLDSRICYLGSMRRVLYFHSPTVTGASTGGILARRMVVKPYFFDFCHFSCVGLIIVHNIANSQVSANFRTYTSVLTKLLAFATNN